MRTERLCRRTLPVVLLALACGPRSDVLRAAEVRVTEGTNLSLDVSPADGSVAMDLLGSLWRVPAEGGDARRLTDTLLPARRPRFAPDGTAILFQTDAPASPQLWRYDTASGVSERLSEDGEIEQHGDWHPDGERIVFVAERGDSGLDLWERDLATGLEWRLSSHPGDESEPAWSANGRHLSYILERDGQWQLMLRPFGKPPVALATSAAPLAAPSWRPDGTLITYLAAQDGRYVLRMAILSEPPLLRTLQSGEDFFLSAAAWQDRDRYLYAADGAIKTRRFEEWQSRRLPFSAAVAGAEQRPAAGASARPLPPVDVAGGDLVVRAARLYDGEAAHYRHDVDIVIEDGSIRAIEAARDRGDRFVLDIGNVTVMPGLIDVYSAMPDGAAAAAGARLLAFGVTTLVTPDAPAGFDARLWDSPDTPGPRLLHAVPALHAADAVEATRLRLAVVDGDGRRGARLLPAVRDWQRRGVPVLAHNWSVGLGTGSDLLLGAAVLPASPLGRRYEDLRLVGGNGPLTFVSGLADAATPGIDELRQARQAASLAPAAARRYASATAFGEDGASIVVGSRPSGLPAGLATQAELRALAASGVAPARVLHAATGAAADALGLGGRLGRIAPGERADLLLLAGDPLAGVGAALDVVAVVRDGRFLSLSSLLERAAVD